MSKWSEQLWIGNLEFVKREKFDPIISVPTNIKNLSLEVFT